ncbi:glycosyltransferase family 2 protein [Geobacter argillaceus]|uniref:GT2 family glycosyltransferase n=1 Tax=Geobacter argillaceus TaxID=345631 RepID=A0A562VN05_9BACT|nr:glycosyltransferase family 2 protein [Geobacter argillaceus]TWJ19290.1 GT2 family glycosyltransferase [Geobacter argillaceus]
MAECSIIIVTYNGLHDYTVPCLESIFGNSGSEDYEVIVVDNNSSDGTPAYLTELSGREPRLKCVLNATNRGFAGGNNDGIGRATGRIIVLLNNDTRVTGGWLATMRSALLDDRSIGLLGPVSNAVGNEQKIFTSGTTPEEILAEGAQWTRRSAGETFEAERLGFFCVAMRRDVLETVGVLDEAYDLGFFEDDDYCIRVRQAGYRLLCREDIFLYHRGSGSFGKMPRQTKELLKKNRVLLERKFGNLPLPRHPRDRQLDLVEQYVRRLSDTKDYERIQHKINNRLHLAMNMKPRGLFKRLRYLIRLRAVRRCIFSL